MKTPKVAYFCMEYGLHSDFKIYSGGLGILAGDLLKAAHDKKAPVVGVGILWRQGYNEQVIDPVTLQQIDTFRSYHYPFLKDTGVKVPVRIRNQVLQVKVWLCDTFENAPLYLLDTDLPENPTRWVTGQLYGWFEEERLAQEIVLGVGGVKALQALGISVDLYHFNEGHAVLAGLELIGQECAQGVGFHEAWKRVRERIVFTTHTPIKEGNEQHNHAALQYTGAALGLTIEQLHEMGGTPFNMTVAALRLSKKANAVAELHGQTARTMWKEVSGASPIVSITNGVHRKTWVAHEFLNPQNLSPAQVQQIHARLKQDLISFIKKETAVTLNPSKLLIGFSRRAATYKRGDLLFFDLNRVRKLIQEQGLQVVFSGKAHPQDSGGKQIIHNIVRMAKEFPNHIVFLPNYSMVTGAMLTRGVDVWLNNPRRPKEACGTSGMKAAMNGVLNLSILDGWWPEACEHGKNGWAIGDESICPTEAEQDKKDADSLYSILEKEVLPTFQKPDIWQGMMLQSIVSTYQKFCAETMLKHYYERLY